MAGVFAVGSFAVFSVAAQRGQAEMFVRDLFRNWHSHWVYTWRDEWRGGHTSECIIDVYDAENGGKTRSVSLGTAMVMWASFPSADGRFLYFAKGEERIYRLDLHTEAIHEIPVNPPIEHIWIEMIGLSQDGKRLFLSDRASLYAIDVQTGASRVLLTIDDEVPWGVHAFSPDMRKFAWFDRKYDCVIADSRSGDVLGKTRMPSREDREGRLPPEIGLIVGSSAYKWTNLSRLDAPPPMFAPLFNDPGRPFTLEPMKLPPVAGEDAVSTIMDVKTPVDGGQYILVTEWHASSAARDKTQHEVIAVWDISTGTCVARLDGPLCLAAEGHSISNDGRTLLVNVGQCTPRTRQSCWLYDISRFAK
jgi:WD40 repeat protein